jgi:hypothetical protein
MPTAPLWNATSSIATNRSTGNLFSNYNTSSGSGGSNNGSTWQAAGVQSFCYNARWPCSQSSSNACATANASCSSNTTCSNRVEAVQMTNADTRYSCVGLEDDAPSLIIVKQAMEAFSPLLFVDWMAEQLPVV